jgi:c-di-GMP-binding flagellar brake protein YcgR
MGQPAYKVKRQHPRFRVRLTAEVVAKSLGNPLPYRFVTSNISMGGAYISGDKNSYPFQSQTLLEVWLLLDKDSDLKIFCNCKIMHTSGSSGFGLKIVQIDGKNEKILKEFIEEYVRKHPDSKIEGPPLS